MHLFLYHYKVQCRVNSEDLVSVINEVNRLLPQLSDFINQFHQVIINTGVNVMTDGVGNLDMDAPGEIPTAEMKKIQTRINIIDTLIRDNRFKVDQLLEQGKSIETDIRNLNSDYRSQLLEQVTRFKELNASYKH